MIEQPKIETKVYTDGTSATGMPPLPPLSPAQQDRIEEESRSDADPGL